MFVTPLLKDFQWWWLCRLSGTLFHI